MSMRSWTEGEKTSLVRVTEPKKDAGNGTLSVEGNMWTYTPKLNRTIRLPYSLMSQSWAGSDFSYNDLSRTDDLLRYYRLTIIDTREADGHSIYTVEAVPYDDAPVVWGKEEWVLRDDYVLVSQSFYDQSMELLKRLDSGEIDRVEAQFEVEKYWVGSLREGAVDGNVEVGSLMAGQSVGLVHDVPTVRELIDTIIGEAHQIVSARLAGMTS